jgi:hypothetical protein
MIKIIIILMLISFSLKLNKCIKHTDFCFLKESKIKCEGVYNLTCGNVVCTKYEDSCRSLTLISSLKNIQKNKKYDGHHMKKFKSFLSLIKDCPKLTEWMPVNVCLSSKNCLKPFIRNIRWIENKQSECKCSGKYSFRCNTDYCGRNKQACNDLKQRKFEIKKCN